MSHPPRDDAYLSDILEAVQRILGYTQKISYSEFMEDTKTQDAVLRNLQVLGEATKKLSISLRRREPLVPWKEMTGLRDKIVHEYFGINYDIVWAIVTQDIPALQPHIEAILERYAGQ